MWKNSIDIKMDNAQLTVLVKAQQAHDSIGARSRSLFL
jgi:hypothetical protein